MTTRYPMFPLFCLSFGLPKPVAEYKFCDTRRWKIDFAWPEYKVALEIDGGLFSKGAHTRGARILQTHDKENAAAAIGWRFIKRTPQNLQSTETAQLLKTAIAYGR